MKYLGLIFLVNVDTSESFSLSLEVDSLDKKTVYDKLTAEALADDDDVDTILVLESREDESHYNVGEHGPIPALGAPHVVCFWRAANGDFEGL